MLKGISPLIAAVILIAFVIAVAAVASGFFTGFIKGRRAEIESKGESMVDCSVANFDVDETTLRKYGHTLSLTIYNKGQTKLSDFMVTVTGNNTGTEQHKVFDGTVNPGNSQYMEANFTEINTPIQKIMVLSKDCSNYVTSITDQDDLPSQSCPDGMAAISEVGGFCIFKYEASRSDATASSEGSTDTAASQQGVQVWVNINQTDAKDSCQNAGYHLCSNKEWQAATQAVIGDNDTFVHGNNNYLCHESTSECCTNDTTGDDRCLAGSSNDSQDWCTDQGVCDLNGNVWEWTDNVWDTDHSCHFEGTSNYVDSWNEQYECPGSLNSSSQEDFGSDYYWSSNNDNRAVRRGGSWSRGARAGPFAMNLYYPPSSSDAYIGFRCCL